MRLRCPTHRSGQILAGFGAEPAGQGLGELVPYPTLDGSFSLHSSAFSEAFHNSVGAFNEAKAKFVRPAELNSWSSSHTLRVLDVCFGLGYNSAAFWDALNEHPQAIEWWGLELDQRPLSIALQDSGFCQLWTSSTLQRLQSLEERGHWSDARGEGRLLWGDARQCIDQCPTNQCFDLIFHDAFSPQRCPQLWSEEFLSRLSRRLAPGGRLLTYSRSAAIRASLQRSGLILRSLLPAPGERVGWSSGTLAAQPPWSGADAPEGEGWRCLTPMELEHLQTRAAVPFRDPSGQDSAIDILRRREKEQLHCGLEATNAWQRRHGLIQPRADH